MDYSETGMEQPRRAAASETTLPFAHFRSCRSRTKVQTEAASSRPVDCRTDQQGVGSTADGSRQTTLVAKRSTSS
eukprot:2954959-Rhodomonas_salina.1